MIGDRVTVIAKKQDNGRWHADFVLYRFWYLWNRWSISMGADNEEAITRMCLETAKMAEKGTLIPSYAKFPGIIGYTLKLWRRRFVKWTRIGR